MSCAVPNPSRRPRLGFAGVGWIGLKRLQAVAAADVADIVSITDISPDCAARGVASLQGWVPQGTVRTARSFDDMLDEDLDGVVIATPSGLHAQQTSAALLRGRAVFCQKPLARTAAETKAVLAAAESTDRLLGVDLSYRHTTGMQRIRELIRGGELGTVYAAELVFHNAYGPDKPWFYDARLSGGGCLLDLGVHLVDLALWCLDFPEIETVAAQLVTQGHTWRERDGVEDYAAGQLSTRSGASIQLACSWQAPAGCDARIEATFFGTNGGASFRNVNGSFYDFVAERFYPDRSRRLLAEPPDPWGGRAAVAWAQQLARSPRFDPQAHHLQQVATVLDRMYGRAPTS